MTTATQELIIRLSRDGDGADEAALIAGLLLERARSPSRRAQATKEIRKVAGEQWARARPSQRDLAALADALIERVSDPRRALPRDVWALSKSSDPRRRNIFLALLEEFASVPAQENLAYQALVGLVVFSDVEATAAIRRAAAAGHGEVQATARKIAALRK